MRLAHSKNRQLIKLKKREFDYFIFYLDFAESTYLILFSFGETLINIWTKYMRKK